MTTQIEKTITLESIISNWDYLVKDTSLSRDVKKNLKFFGQNDLDQAEVAQLQVDLNYLVRNYQIDSNLARQILDLLG